MVKKFINFKIDEYKHKQEELELSLQDYLIEYKNYINDNIESLNYKIDAEIIPIIIFLLKSPDISSSVKILASKWLLSKNYYPYYEIIISQYKDLKRKSQIDEIENVEWEKISFLAGNKTIEKKLKRKLKSDSIWQKYKSVILLSSKYGVDKYINDFTIVLLKGIFNKDFLREVKNELIDIFYQYFNHAATIDITGLLHSGNESLRLRGYCFLVAYFEFISSNPVSLIHGEDTESYLKEYLGEVVSGLNDTIPIRRICIFLFHNYLFSYIQSDYLLKELSKYRDRATLEYYNLLKSGRQPDQIKEIDIEKFLELDILN